MKSKIILLFAILVFAALTILLSMLIEKTKTPPINSKVKKEIKEKPTKKKKSDSYNFNNFNNFEKNKEEKTSSGALESMQWMTQIRAYPETDIPADKFYKAFEYSKNNLQDINTKDGIEEWRSLGPNNIGGRSLCVAVHPSDTGTVFIGSSSGGLWKSTTGGNGAEAWILVNTGFPSSAVSSIAIDSVNPNVMYIGTGENYGYEFSENGLDVRVTRGMYGIGILKTTDGGITWTKSLDWTYDNKRGVWKVLINPKNSSILYAATSEGIYKSVNAGINWDLQLPYEMVMDLEINSSDTNILYASIGNLTNNVPQTNKGIFKTINGGANWTKLSGGLPANWSGKATIEIYKGNQNFIYASIPNDFSYVGYYKSTNGGTSWTSGSTSVPIGTQGWYNNGHFVKSNDPNSILVGTINVEKSINGGTSFTSKSAWYLWNEGATPPGDPEGPDDFVHADVHFYTDNPKDPNKIYIAADGGLYRSNDFGETYYSCNGGFVTSQFYASFANSYQDSVFAIGGLQDNRAAIYQGNNAWFKTFYGDGMSCAVNSQNDQICYTEYTYGAISRSTDGGLNWSGVEPPGAGNQNDYCFVAPYVCCNSNPSVLYAGGKSIYKSVNGGNSWTGPYGTTVIGGTKILSMANSNSSIDTIYCGAVNGKIFKSVNAGLNWSDITDISVTPDRYATDMTLNPGNSNDIIVTFGGFNTGHVYRSTNGGSLWQDISGNLPDVPHHSVVMDPDYTQNIYVGNDLGVYVSTNGGTVWHEYRSGMPYALVFDLTVVNANRQLRIATYGNGIWERKLLENPVSVNNAETQLIDGFNLNQNYPNPFNPNTVISFNIPPVPKGQTSDVKLIVYDMNGREVKTLADRKFISGNYNFNFAGNGLSSGVYFYKLIVTGGSVNFSDTKSMILLK